MKKIAKLALTDFKLIFRDPTLRSFLALPVLLFLLVVYLVPYLADTYEALAPYLPLFLIVGAIENTQLFCFISSIVLIDEKESDVAKVYGVVPMSKGQYILSRFMIPYLFTVLLNVILFAVQPLFSIGWGLNLILSLLSALIVPVYALAINSMVENRIKGMVYIKAFNMVVLIPIAAFFVPDSFSHLFGILPTHWIFQSIEQVALGSLPWWMPLIGFAFFAVLTVWVARVFIRRHFA